RSDPDVRGGSEEYRGRWRDRGLNVPRASRSTARAGAEGGRDSAPRRWHHLPDGFTSRLADALIISSYLFRKLPQGGFFSGRAVGLRAILGSVVLRRESSVKFKNRGRRRDCAACAMRFASGSR